MDLYFRDTIVGEVEYLKTEGLTVKEIAERLNLDEAIVHEILEEN